MQVNTATRIDSYKDMLIDVLNDIHPKTVLEWGPGVSTQIISKHPSVERIDAIEDDEYYYSKALALRTPKVNVYLVKDTESYTQAKNINALDNYDLIFVDGKGRNECLSFSRDKKMRSDSVLILHDAERGWYQTQINKFKSAVWGDNGNTVILRNA